MKYYTTVYFIFFIINYCASSKILGIFNHPAVSHTHLGKVLLKNLAKRGHDVTMASAFPLDAPMKNYKDIEIEGIYEDLKRREMMYFEKTKKNQFSQTINMTLEHTIKTINNREIQKMMKDGETFDLVIIDMFYNDALLIFGYIFKAPVIIMSSFGNNLVSNVYTGNTLPASYVPGAGLATTDNMPFLNRFIMGYLSIILDVILNTRVKNLNYEIVKKYFALPPPMESLYDNVALVLSNSHYSFETSRPYTPNIIPIGGFHIEEPKPLTLELRDFLDGAKDGVILFSLGSQIKAANLEKNITGEMLKAFAKVPQRVLWKYEKINLKNVPSNVKISKWFPQTDLLAHTNVKLFVTHGGALSLIETIYFGVPVVGIPFLGDQVTNVKFAESRGFGVGLASAEEITETKLLKAMQEVIQNPKYGKMAKYYSELLRNQPIKPIDNAIFWMEHVIKHRNTSYLKPYSLKLSWYQYYMVDVIGVSLIALLLCLILLKVSFRLLRKVAKICSCRIMGKPKSE